MQCFKRTLRLGIAGLMLAPMALADQVQVQDLGATYNAGRSTTVTLSGGLTFHDGSTEAFIWAGRRSLLVDGQLIRSFALQVDDAYGSGQYDQIAVGDRLDANQAEALTSLFAANNGGEIRRREDAVAFQALIWEIVYDFDGSEASLDPAAGRVRTARVSRTIFAGMRSTAMRGGGGSLDVLTSGEYSDMLRVVPLPSSAALAGVGLAGVAARRRRV